MKHTFVFNLLGFSIIQTVLHCVSHVERIFSSYFNKTETHGHFVAAGLLGEMQSGFLAVAKWCDGSSRMKRLGLFYIKATTIRTQQDRQRVTLWA